MHPWPGLPPGRPLSGLASRRSVRARFVRPNVASFLALGRAEVQGGPVINPLHFRRRRYTLSEVQCYAIDFNGFYVNTAPGEVFHKGGRLWLFID